MKKAFLCLCVLCVAATAALGGAAHAGDAESARWLRVSQVLFPQTRGWTAVDTLPGLETRILLRERWLLRSTYLKSGANGLMEDPDCSFVLKALWEHVDDPAFRLADFDGDGLEDIMYSGYAHCREGHHTVIWFGAQRGILRPDVSVIFGRVLAVELGGERRLSDISVGCCDDPIDEYSIRDLRGQTIGARAHIHKATYLPESMELADERFAAKGGVALKAAPLAEYAFKPGARDSMTGALMTDVGARYAPGAKGTVVARYKDPKGKWWRLVVVEESSRSLQTEGREAVDVGWIPGR